MAASAKGPIHQAYEGLSRFLTTQWNQFARTENGQKFQAFFANDPNARKVAAFLGTRNAKDGIGALAFGATVAMLYNKSFFWGLVTTGVGASLVWCYKRHFNPNLPQARLSVVGAPAAHNGQTGRVYSVTAPPAIGTSGRPASSSVGPVRSSAHPA